jgi:hypothetical protein
LSRLFPDIGRGLLVIIRDESQALEDVASRKEEGKRKNKQYREGAQTVKEVDP